MTDTVNSAAGVVRAQRLRMLAVSTAKRIDLFPDMPTLAESSMPGFETNDWHGMLAPAGTPQPIVQRQNAERMKALQHPEVRKKLGAQGGRGAARLQPRGVRQLHKPEMACWSRITRQTGVSLG